MLLWLYANRLSGVFPVAETLVDSSVIIDYLRGHSGAVTYLDALLAGNELATHAVVVAEVLCGARNRNEQNTIEEFFSRFQVYSIEAQDSRLSLDLLKRTRLAFGVGWLDCLIAATSLRLALVVTTLNEKHFGVFEGLSVMRPYYNSVAANKQAKARGILNQSAGTRIRSVQPFGASRSRAGSGGGLLVPSCGAGSGRRPNGRPPRPVVACRPPALRDRFARGSRPPGRRRCRS